jgi:uncharacterized membrane protein
MTDDVTTNQTDGSAPAGGPTTSATEPAVGLITDGAYALIVARYATMADAQAAYELLRQIEQTTSLRIDGVVVASSDANGKVTLGTVTEHSTREGVRWGLVGGIALGLIFPPTVLAGAAAGGALGAAIGKIRNLAHRRGLAEELEGIMQPNTAGVVALVEDEAVLDVQRALARADQIVTRAIDRQVALEIDREAAAATASLGS